VVRLKVVGLLDVLGDLLRSCGRARPQPQRPAKEPGHISQILVLTLRSKSLEPFKVFLWRGEGPMRMSRPYLTQNVLKVVLKNQFHHKSVNVSCIITEIKNGLAIFLCGNGRSGLQG